MFVGTFSCSFCCSVSVAFKFEFSLIKMSATPSRPLRVPNTVSLPSKQFWIYRMKGHRLACPAVKPCSCGSVYLYGFRVLKPSKLKLKPYSHSYIGTPADLIQGVMNKLLQQPILGINMQDVLAIQTVGIVVGALAVKCIIFKLRFLSPRRDCTHGPTINDLNSAHPPSGFTFHGKHICSYVEKKWLRRQLRREKLFIMFPLLLKRVLAFTSSTVRCASPPDVFLVEKTRLYNYNCFTCKMHKICVD